MSKLPPSIDESLKRDPIYQDARRRRVEASKKRNRDRGWRWVDGKLVNLKRELDRG